MATLSNKLISAINHQTNLDDTLAATRQELDALKTRVQQLEAENKEHIDLVTSGALVRKSEVEEQASKLVAKLAEERKRRMTVEKDKKGIEQELESLTTALFEEANQVTQPLPVAVQLLMLSRWLRLLAKTERRQSAEMNSFERS